MISFDFLPIPMRFSCEKKDFLEALSTVQKAINSQHTLPVLGNIFLKAEAQRIHLIATNLEIAISTKIDAEVKNEGSITVPARVLVNAISFLKEGKLEVLLEGGDTVRIKSQGTNTKMKGLSADEFPELPVVQKEISFSLPANILKNAFENTVFSCSPSSSRPVLSGVLLWMRNHELRFVGTDSYRLGEKKLMVEQSFPDEKFIIPARTVQELCRILGKEEGNAEILVSKTQILFTSGNTEITSRLIEGNFPEYERIIPQSSLGNAEVSKSDLILAIKRAGIFAREVDNNNVKMTFQENTIVIQTDETEIGADNTEIEAVHTGDGETVALNAQYLLDILQNLNGEKIQISYGERLSPVVFRSTSDEGFVHIIMPLKV